jgi:hypothetical protein
MAAFTDQNGISIAAPYDPGIPREPEEVEDEDEDVQYTVHVHLVASGF